jgi:polar amino acid transport system ATP-binding protein
MERRVNDLVRMDSLALSRAGRAVLSGVTFSVARREFCALMGLSGSGKTTALRAIAALEPFDSGSLAVGGFSLRPGPLPSEAHLAPLRESVGLVFQMHALFEHLTALENVALSPVYVDRQPRREAEARSLRLLESLGVGARAAAYPRELSGGEAQRVAIARALAVDPPLLLMDEPTASLDPARRGALGETLRALAADGRGLLVATHDTDFARDFADRVVVLAQGRVVEEGRPEEVLGNPSHSATRDLLEWRKAPQPQAS